MKKFIVAVGVLLLAGCGLLLSLSPDTFTIIILSAMCFVIAFGLFVGLMPALFFGNGFRNARESIDHTTDVQSTENWIAVFKLEVLFRQPQLERVFKEYKLKIEQEKETEEIESDIEDYISEDLLSLYTWQGFILQIPGILTGLGILGTFIGLITGISSIGFSSVNAALESVSTLLGGIKTAFYTSISGVILSILFNILYRLIWNNLLREYGMFLDIFHKSVIPPTKELSRIRLNKQMKQVLKRLDRIPKNSGFSLSAINGENGKGEANEQIMMPQVIEGLKKGEFIFYLQPRVFLATKKIVAAEALVRWNHEELGMLSPSSFISMLEKNGFITRLDAYIWETVFQTVRSWIDAGLRPVPISINISKTDIMAMDVAGFFENMLQKYHIPPQSLEVEIAKTAYVQSVDSVTEVAGRLRRLGFKVIMDSFDGDYISVNMLSNMETDALKLDLRFMPEHEYTSIEAIFEQARKLKIEVIAEGIENTEQITYLKKAGCLSGQGFYFYKPISVQEFENQTE